MTVAEIIEQQRRKCEADKQARLKRAQTPKPSTPPPAPKKMSAAERERAFIEDRTYDGKPPEGGWPGLSVRKARMNTLPATERAPLFHGAMWPCRTLNSLIMAIHIGSRPRMIT